MKSLTVAYITAREKPEFGWWLDSLAHQCEVGEVSCLAISLRDDEGHHPISRYGQWRANDTVVFRKPKPTHWQGPSRLTRENWFAVANARNSALALCETEWIAFLDDRCVLCPGWLESIQMAMRSGYAVCGTYEKRHGMKVKRGCIIDTGFLAGQDSREPIAAGKPMPFPCGGEWWFGCNTALPLEWALSINGYDESCDGLGMEDVIFGLHLQNAGYPIRYDTRMKIIEDRTPELTGPVMKRTDKGISPNDKSHALLNRLRHLKRSTNPFDLREIRATVLAGGDFPIPTGPTHDWYDGQPLAEM